MSARSKSIGGAVLSRSSADSVLRLVDENLAEFDDVAVRELFAFNWSLRIDISTFAS